MDVSRRLRQTLPKPLREALRSAQGSALGFGTNVRRAASTFGGRQRNHSPLESVRLGASPPLMAEIAYNKYGVYCVPLSSRHRPAAQAVLRSRVYELETIEFIQDECGTGDIVHAGTFFGDFLPALSHSASKDSLIWAFEPNPESFRCAEITVMLNGLKNIRLTNAGLGASESRAHFRTLDPKGRPLGGRSMVVSEDDSNPSDEQVSLVRLDDIVPSGRNVSVLQLDVEGFEEQALGGALDTIRRCRPVIVLEVTPDSRLLDSDFFASAILPLGYRQVSEFCDNVVYVA